MLGQFVNRGRAHSLPTGLPGKQGEWDELMHTRLQHVDDFHWNDDGIGVDGIIYAAFLGWEMARTFSGVVTQGKALINQAGSTQMGLERKGWEGGKYDVTQSIRGMGRENAPVGVAEAVKGCSRLMWS